MKWLFFTLVALNLIVFSAFLAKKIYQPAPAPVATVSTPAPTPQQAPPQVIINTGALTTPATSTGDATRSAVATRPTVSNGNKATPSPAKPANTSAPEGEAKARYSACSARVSMPENDYHRIKGLLNNYPHAATRQVVQGGGEGQEQSSARMNVLFMNVDDQAASAIQAVVGRYGQLNRTACNR